jgi:hypothetical protein
MEKTVSNVIIEKSVPTNKKLYSSIKSRIKSKFKVWPSAYASAALVKAYKNAGGSYKTVKETVKNAELRLEGYCMNESEKIIELYFAVMEKMEEGLNEAEYRGRKVSLGKPFRTPNGPKKFSVYVRKPNGNIVKVNFGHKGSGGEKTMKIKKSNPERRKAFRARHRCATPGPRHKARYWSCRFGWPKSGKGSIDKT